MDLTFILSAAIFTLLAIVVATSLLNGDLANGHRGDRPGSGLDQSGPRQNGHVPDTMMMMKKKKKEEEEEEKEKEKAEDDWCEISGSSHDHWDVVKSVLSEEEHPHPHSEELATPVEHSSSSRSVSLETEGAAESPGINEKVESNANNPLRYLPGKARSHHLEMMMSKDELEEEQRVQREQLAAIFQLLKDNKETFGEVTEGDMEEQLKLYSI